MMVILTHPPNALTAQPGTTLQQGLPAARSVQRVGMTLTLILRLHAWTVQLVSTLQRGLHLALPAQPGTTLHQGLHLALIARPDMQI